jgi:uncharacterized protein
MYKKNSSTAIFAKGWIRVLVFVVSFLIVLMAGIAVIVFGFHKGDFSGTGIQSLAKDGNLWTMTLIFFVISVLITYVFRNWIDRKSFISLGLDIVGRWREAVAGSLLAIFIISAVSLLLKATGHLKWTEIIFDPRILFLSFGSAVLISFSEELVFRGYILNNLLGSFSKWIALLISAILFMIFHWTSLVFNLFSCKLEFYDRPDIRVFWRRVVSNPATNRTKR